MDGQYIDTKYLVSPTKEGRSSFFRFPREKPTKEDWILWENFWKGFCNNGRHLHQQLGHWRAPSHKIWRWFSDNVCDKIYEQYLEQFWVYKLWHRSLPCLGSLYRLLGEVKVIPVDVSPLTVTEVLPGVVAKVGIGPRLQTSPPPQTSFWEYLASLGREWMWDYVSDTSADTTWIRDGLLSASLILSTDGSHQPKTDPTVSATGWVIACTSAAQHVKGSFYKCSSSASSYQGELLGLTAIHILILASCWYYSLPKARG